MLTQLRGSPEAKLVVPSMGSIIQVGLLVKGGIVPVPVVSSPIIFLSLCELQRVIEDVSK